MKNSRFIRQRIIMLATTAVLMTAILSYGTYHHVHSTPHPTAANASVQTGLSIYFPQPLQHNLDAELRNTKGMLIRKQQLESGAQQFNIALRPGVYQMIVHGKSTPPSEPQTVTITDGRVSSVAINTSVN